MQMIVRECFGTFSAGWLVYAYIWIDRNFPTTFRILIHTHAADSRRIVRTNKNRRHRRTNEPQVELPHRRLCPNTYLRR